MSAELFNGLFSAPILLALTGLFVFFVTSWSDRRDKLAAQKREKRP